MSGTGETDECTSLRQVQIPSTTINSNNNTDANKMELNNNKKIIIKIIIDFLILLCGKTELFKLLHHLKTYRIFSV